MYSTQSGEERQVRVPPAVILAALGPNIDRLSSVNERPPGASVEPMPSFKTSGELGQESNRLSHISAGSMQLNVQVVDHTSPLPIGLAYGGEEQGS